MHAKLQACMLTQSKITPMQANSTDYLLPDLKCIPDHYCIFYSRCTPVIMEDDYLKYLKYKVVNGSETLPTETPLILAHMSSGTPSWYLWAVPHWHVLFVYIKTHTEGTYIHKICVKSNKDHICQLHP